MHRVDAPRHQSLLPNNSSPPATMHAAPFPSPQGFHLKLGDLSSIEPSGFVPPKRRRTYTDGLVQHYLQTAFGELFPSMRIASENFAQFWHIADGVETCGISRPAASIEEIGQPVASRLLGGWSSLCEATRQAPTGEGIRSLLLHLHLPDPRYALDFYRVAETPGKTPLLHIFYGFDSIQKPSLPVAEALSIFLGISMDDADALLFQAVQGAGAVPAPREPAAPPARRRGLFQRLGFAASAVAVATTAALSMVAPKRNHEGPPGPDDPAGPRPTDRGATRQH